MKRELDEVEYCNYDCSEYHYNPEDFKRSEFYIHRFRNGDVDSVLPLLLFLHPLRLL